MIDPRVIVEGAKRLWDMIPEGMRDWTKSEVLNFVRKKAPDFFRFCKNKVSAFWARVTNKEVKTAVDTTTSNFMSLNDEIPLDVKKSLFEQITGSEYSPDPNIRTQGLVEIVQTDDEKKAAAMQMAYLIAVLGNINQKQEIMTKEYMTSLRITEELRKDIEQELQDAEKEFARFVEELRSLDEEFKRMSIETQKAKNKANDIIDLI